MSNEISHLKFGLSRLNPVISGTFGAMTLTGAVAGGDQTWTNVGDMTFAAGSILASGSTNGNTLLIKANDTTLMTFTTGVTDTLDIGAHNISGDSTVTATKALTFGNAGIKITDTYLEFGDAAGTLGPKLTYGTAILLQLRNAANDSYANIQLNQIQAQRFYAIADAASIDAFGVNDNYMTLKAMDTGVGVIEVARLQGAADPWLGCGANGNAAKFYNSGVAELCGKVGFGAAGSVTIATGVIAVTKSYHTVVVQGGAGGGADDLTSATGGAAGDILILKPSTSGANDTVTVIDGTGTGAFILDGGAAFIMDHVDDRIMLISNGTEWVEISRSSGS